MLLKERKTRNSNSIGEGELFAQLSRRSNSLPEDTVKEVYYGLIKVMIDQFKKGKEIILPGLGKFYLIERKDYKRFNFKTGVLTLKARMRKVVFVGCKAFKSYINEMEIKD